MTWGMGGWDLRYRELEQFVRRVLHISREDPERDLAGVELTDSERQEALRREIRRRTLTERS